MAIALGTLSVKAQRGDPDIWIEASNGTRLRLTGTEALVLAQALIKSARICTLPPKAPGDE